MMKSKLLVMSLLTTVLSFFGCSACAQMPQGALLKLNYTKSGSMAGFEYFVQVAQTDSDVIVLRAMKESYGQLYEKKLTPAELQGFVQIIQEEKMYAYAESYKPMLEVLDGYMWTFDARFADKTISSHGSNARPSGNGLERIRDYSVQLVKDGTPLEGWPEDYME